MSAVNKRLIWSLGVVMLAAACLPVAETEPAAEPDTGPSITTPETPADAPPELPASPSPDVYPPLPTPTHTLPPYPWPTATPGPTDPPEPTEIPTETPPPVPTLPPTPVVTLFPTAAPPYIAFPEGTAAQPFTLYYRDGDVIRSLSSAAGAESELFLDPLAEFGLHLPPEEAYVWNWGAFSPDGRRAALILTDVPEPLDYPRTVHPVALYILDLAERSLRRVGERAYDPVWSPDGKRLAYRSDGLQIMDVETAEAIQVYDPAEEHFVNFYSWSPDMGRIVLMDELPFDSAQLYVIDIDQKEPPVHLNADSLYWAGAPRWSPVEDWIAFSWAAPGWPHRSDLWLKSSDGTDGRQMTQDISVQGVQWSPDGRWLAFGGLAIYEHEHPPWNLWLLDPVSGELRRLTYGSNPSYGDTLINWSPDGTQLISSRSMDNLQEVWVKSLIDGSERMLLDSILVRDSGLTIGP